MRGLIFKAYKNKEKISIKDGMLNLSKILGQTKYIAAVLIMSSQKLSSTTSQA